MNSMQMSVKARVISVLLVAAAVGLGQPSATIERQVTDPIGAAVLRASVQLLDLDRLVRTATTDDQGRYRLTELSEGDYKIRVAGSGFAQYESATLHVAIGRAQTLDVRLQIQQEKQSLTVDATASQIGVDASQSVGQMVLRGSDLDSFSDDAEDLANELQMLAGPSPGPDGGQILIDGFSGGILPPKASIREIRVNQNPFSAEYDRVGFGCVEVFTKPGSDHYHGRPAPPCRLCSS
jgi:hypothetical protein